MKHILIIKRFLLVCSLFCFPLVWGQQITGTVTDQTGVPLPGASVLEKGTTNGTQTDFDGHYNFELKNENAILVFSYVGFTTIEIKADGQSIIDVSLDEDVAKLDEVVVVGYGVQRKKDLISAISKIDSENIVKNSSANFTDALQGSVNGVQLSSSGGDPTANTRILIRGTGSITTDTEPLIILDGVPIASGGTNPLNYLSPNDIADVSVLKDASATAIYGSRGANGVLLITTKTGKSGMRYLSFSVDTGVTNPINEVELANANEWRSLVSSARINSGLAGDTDVISAQGMLVDKRQQARYTSEDLYNTGSTNWVDKLQQRGIFTQYSLSASAGTEKASYYISGQYRTQEGNIISENFDRLTARINLDFNATDFMKIGTRYTVVHEDNDVLATNQSQYSFSDRIINRGLHTKFNTLYTSALPIYPEVYANGDPFEPLSGNNLTYLLDPSRNSNNEKTLRHIGGVYASIEPIKNLILKLDVGGSYEDKSIKQFLGVRAGILTEEDASLPADQQVLLDYIYDGGVPRIYNRNFKEFTYNIVGTASYNKTFAEKHNTSFLLGWEQNHYQGKTTQLDFENASSLNDPTELGFNVRDGAQLLEVRNQIYPEVRFYSQFARVNYNFDSKYFLQATVRRDGSSKFTPGDRFNIFPSFSAGWVISSEDFWNIDAVNYLKLRGGYGKTGNANIDPFLFYDSYLTWPNYPDRSNAQIIESMGANPIEWEKSATTDVALEFGMFKNRFSGSIGYYNTKTTDLLLSFPLAYSIGVYNLDTNATALGNVGSLRNSGLEIELNSINISNKNFKWTTNFNISTNKNKVIELYPGFDNSDPSALSFGNYTGINTGSILGEFYLPEFAGYDANGNTLIKDIETGESILNTPTAMMNNRVLQDKSGLPKFFGGLSNTFSYKGLSLDILFTFQGGHYILDDFGADAVGTGNSVLRKDLLTNSFNGNQDAYYGELSWNNQSVVGTGETSQAVSSVSTKKLHKADMIRLRNITLGYDFGSSIKEWQNSIFKGASLYVKLQNVATFSKFDLTDPEVLTVGDSAQDRNLGQGVLNTIPRWQVMTASMGINLTF